MRPFVLLACTHLLQQVHAPTALQTPTQTPVVGLGFYHALPALSTPIPLLAPQWQLCVTAPLVSTGIQTPCNAYTVKPIHFVLWVAVHPLNVQPSPPLLQGHRPLQIASVNLATIL